MISWIQNYINNIKERNQFKKEVEMEAKELRREAYKKAKLEQASKEGRVLAKNDSIIPKFQMEREK